MVCLYSTIKTMHGPINLRLSVIKYLRLWSVRENRQAIRKSWRECISRVVGRPLALAECMECLIATAMPKDSTATYSTAHSPSWEAKWFATSQEIPRISRNPKVHYRTHKILDDLCSQHTRRQLLSKKIPHKENTSHISTTSQFNVAKCISEEISSRIRTAPKQWHTARLQLSDFKTSHSTAQCLLYVPQSLTLYNSMFCPHIVFICILC